MKSAAFVFGLVISFTVAASAQVRTVTNATLEKYQQKRLAAERDYRENYERLGFPSPEELDRQRDADMKARLELADQLRQARLEKERMELERRGLALEERQFEFQVEERNYGDPYYGWSGIGGYFGGGDGFRRHPRRFPVRPYPGNRLLPTRDTSTTRFTPFGPVRVPGATPVIINRGRGGIRGPRR